MAVAVRPVRFISDVLTRKQILKTDANDNVLFKVSGSSAESGHVSSSLPITSSGLFIDGDALIAGTLTAKRMHVTEVTTSVYYEDALSASINALQDVSASNANVGDMLKWDGINWISSNEISGNFIGDVTGNILGNLLGTSSYAITSSYAVNANNAVNSLNANTASYALNAGTALTALYAVNAGNLIGSGTTNTIPVFTNDTSVGNSNLSLSGSTLIAGDDVVVSGGLYFSNPLNMSSISPALSSATGFYGISDTFNAINNKFALLMDNYAKLSETIVGNFDIDGTKEIQLSNFIATDLDNIYVDVMVKHSGSSQYINDLISVSISANIVTNTIHVLLNAAALTSNDSFRIVATKQTGSLF